MQSLNRSEKHQTTYLDILFLTLILGTLFFISLNTRPLLVPEEGRYAEIIREMLLSHDYITPYLNGVKYFEKPILFYWLGVFITKIFGLSIISLRTINACFATAGCLLTYAVARKLYDRWSGIYAALILGASGLYLAMSQVINVDMSATFFISLSLYGFLVGTQESENKKRRNYLWLAFAAAACAVLTKGLVGIIFPVMIAGLWILLLNQWQLLRSLYLPSSFFIFLCIVIPWHVLISMQHSEFFYFYFIEQQFLRFATLEIGHYQPVWFFIPILIAGFFPWVAFLPQAILFARNESKPISSVNLFLIIWAVAIFIFFSLSKSKLVSYILPVFPPLALLIGHYFANKIMQRKKILLLWGATVILLLTLIPMIAASNTNSTLLLANVIKSSVTPQDEVVAYKQYYQDLPFYLNRLVTVVEWRGELAFGSAHQDVSAHMIDDKTFWQRWHSQKKLFVITDDNEFTLLRQQYPTEKFCVLASTVTNVLFTQCKKQQK